LPDRHALNRTESTRPVLPAASSRPDPLRPAEGSSPDRFRRVRRPRGCYARIGKPVLDRTLASVLLVAAAPLMALVAVIVWIGFGRSLIFRQRRIGRDGVPFTVFKFRTMRPDRRRRRLGVDRERRRTHKTEHDPRHTRIGRWLRSWSLDELPQLWNVVRGDMSLVGPRPELVEVVERYEPWQHQRHLVKPGLTGMWQVSRRGEGLMYLYTDVDLEYIAAMGLRNDLAILRRTIPAALARSGS
jgi:lipopolysaccharide/colanic/teichoic acid biosynthesis glycosyltransferase